MCAHRRGVWGSQVHRPTLLDLEQTLSWPLTLTQPIFSVKAQAKPKRLRETCGFTEAARFAEISFRQKCSE